MLQDKLNQENRVRNQENRIQDQGRARRLLNPEFIRDWAEIWREHGFKGLVKRKGWTVVIGFFVFYLIRDSFLYLLLPYLAARGLLGC